MTILHIKKIIVTFFCGVILETIRDGINKKKQTTPRSQYSSFKERKKHVHYWMQNKNSVYLPNYVVMQDFKVWAPFV